MSAAAAGENGVLLRFAASTLVVLPSGGRHEFKAGVHWVDADFADKLVAAGDAQYAEPKPVANEADDAQAAAEAKAKADAEVAAAAQSAAEEAPEPEPEPEPEADAAVKPKKAGKK